jgi:hypothetical protein
MPDLAGIFPDFPVFASSIPGQGGFVAWPGMQKAGPITKVVYNFSCMYFLQNLSDKEISRSSTRISESHAPTLKRQERMGRGC